MYEDTYEILLYCSASVLCLIIIIIVYCYVDGKPNTPNKMIEN